MRKGKLLKVTGTSPGNKIVDTYSLLGFTKALRLIDKVVLNQLLKALIICPRSNKIYWILVLKNYRIFVLLTNFQNLELLRSGDGSTVLGHKLLKI